MESLQSLVIFISFSKREYTSHNAWCGLEENFIVGVINLTEALLTFTSASQMRSVLSDELKMMDLPSCENATDLTASVCPKSGIATALPHCWLVLESPVS